MAPVGPREPTNDAEAICEAVQRPTMRFVPVKSEETQGAAMVFRVGEPLIIDTNSVIIKRNTHAAARPRTWLGGMLSRKPPMLVRVALANKMARIVWALMAKGGVYCSPAAAA